ncbi:hypothetical protein B296_00003268 [Ensete ventricosum]|uniref:Uncharacterized protein n=1 Tax=Ensete ventricosum TaxID=4639 RepID=A0A427B8K3_ENSVE|nr:hypothetical protein B296_00003268 [Ensete ventricosum]
MSIGPSSETAPPPGSWLGLHPYRPPCLGVEPPRFAPTSGLLLALGLPELGLETLQLLGHLTDPSLDGHHRHRVYLLFELIDLGRSPSIILESLSMTLPESRTRSIRPIEKLWCCEVDVSAQTTEGI